MQIEDLPTWSQASSQAEFRWERPELPEQIIDNNIKQDQISWTNIKQHASNCIRTHTHTHLCDTGVRAEGSSNCRAKQPYTRGANMSNGWNIQFTKNWTIVFIISMQHNCLIILKTSAIDFLPKGGIARILHLCQTNDTLHITSPNVVL